jgi:hypothetical protein
MSPAFGYPQLVNNTDIRMIEGGSCECFLFKALHPAGIACELWGNQLESDLAAQLLIFGEIDVAHTARAQWAQDRITAYFLTSQEFGFFTCKDAGSKFISTGRLRQPGRDSPNALPVEALEQIGISLLSFANYHG